MIVHILDKDISYDSKLNESKNCHFWVKYSNSVLNCLSFIIIPLDSEIQIKVGTSGHFFSFQQVEIFFH